MIDRVVRAGKLKGDVRHLVEGWQQSKIIDEMMMMRLVPEVHLLFSGVTRVVADGRGRYGV